MDAVTGVEPLARRVRTNVERVIVGKAEVIEQALVAVLCEGHVLIEDVPGIGKTMLAKALARSLGCSFRRVQCTPDLLPSDITGLEFFNQKAQAFEFRPGPVFAQIILADEINRATPRTQSALLESMEERQVTVEGQTRALPRPFLVLATQNPVELQGTFPLPEAQLDRFLLRIVLGYPSAADEQEILRRYRTDRPLDDLQPVAAPDEVLAMAEGLAEDAGDTILVMRGTDQATNGANPKSAEAVDPPAETTEVDLKRLLESRDASLNVVVHPGDVVKVSRAGIVYVVGEVKKPGGFILKTNENITVLQALALSEGLLKTSAKSRARIIRTDESSGTRREIPVDLGKILAGKTAEPRLLPRDILFVPASGGKAAFYKSAEAAVSIVSGVIIFRR